MVTGRPPAVGSLKRPHPLDTVTSKHPQRVLLQQKQRRHITWGKCSSAVLLAAAPGSRPAPPLPPPVSGPRHTLCAPCCMSWCSPRPRPSRPLWWLSLQTPGRAAVWPAEVALGTSLTTDGSCKGCVQHRALQTLILVFFQNGTRNPSPVSNPHWGKKVAFMFV